MLADASIVGKLHHRDQEDRRRQGMTTQQEFNLIVERSQRAQKWLATVPAPVRGQLIQEFGDLVARYKDSLGMNITAEARKIVSEALGEVQEMVDVCRFATGLSRQLYGLTMPSERPNHRMQETWHPLGVVGVISAFNFPMAVWAWNHALATVCGDSVVWKPSPRTQVCAEVCKRVWDMACTNMPQAADLLLIVTGGNEVAEWMADDARVALLSATGSTEMGKALAPRVAARLGRGLYELGGNNAMIVSQYANLDLAVRAIVFSAVGTSGQRCTTLRRLIVHRSIYNELVGRVIKAYDGLEVGDPASPFTLVGPLIDEAAVDRMQDALHAALTEGHTVRGGLLRRDLGPAYVTPAIVECANQTAIVRKETFAPILYVMPYDTLDQAIAMQNDVPQGLSSCIFTDNLQEAETFISALGSDCGIANVNIGPSGAEIGGAFGGEKDTGGGRESGSDSWKAYMRRQTITINYGKDLPLAQGVKFDV
jgi:aldehyde dehydrogenase (NAD+)